MEPYPLETEDSPSMKMFILTSVACILAYFLTKTVATFKVLLNERVVETEMDEDEEQEEEEGAEQEEQEEGEEQEEEEQEEEEDEEEGKKDQDNMLVEDIDDDMPSLETGMPHLEDIIEMTPFTVTLNAETSERTLDLSGNIPWSFLPFTLENNDVNPELRTREMLVDTQINELKTELKSFATHEAVDLLCQQMHELSQKNNLNDVSAIVTEMRSQLETFATKESLSSLTQEVSSLKSHVAQMITDMTALMDKMNLVDSLTIEKEVRQAWFGKVSGTADSSGSGTLATIDLTVRITYDKAHSVSDNKSWLASVKKDDRESHRDGLVGYTDIEGWHIDPVKKTAIKRYHKNEWSGDATDIHVSIDFSKDAPANYAYLTGNKGIPFAKILSSFYQDKKIVWERQLLNI